MFFPSRRGKSVFPQLWSRAKRAARRLPHQGAKESAKRYAEFKHPHTGHVTVGRIY